MVSMVVLLAFYLAALAWVVNCTNAAARDGARAASLGQDYEKAVKGTLPGALNDPPLIERQVNGKNVTVTVTVVYDIPLRPIEVTREVTMRRQR